MVQTQFGHELKILRSDNGGEYVSQDMKLFLQDNGIEAQLPIYTTTGVAERKNRHLLEVTRCLLIGMNVPNLSWD